MLLTVESVKSAPKSLVLKAGGKEYFAKKDSGIGVGMTIDAETEDSEYNGKTYCWVKKWKATAATSAAPHVATPATGNGTSSAWLPFASNTVAHAISAGIITSPNQVEAWARAAKEAFYKINGEI